MVEFTYNQKTYSGVVAELPGQGEKVIGFRNVTPEEQEEREARRRKPKKGESVILSQGGKEYDAVVTDLPGQPGVIVGFRNVPLEEQRERDFEIERKKSVKTGQFFSIYEGKSKAETAAEQIQIRQGFPSATRTIPKQAEITLTQARPGIPPPPPPEQNMKYKPIKEQIISGVKTVGEEFIISPLKKTVTEFKSIQYESIKSRGLSFEKSPGFVQRFLKEGKELSEQRGKGLQISDLEAPAFWATVPLAAGKVGKVIYTGVTGYETYKLAKDPSVYQATRVATIAATPKIFEGISKVGTKTKNLFIKDIQTDIVLTAKPGKKLTYVGSGKVAGKPSLVVLTNKKTYIRSRSGLDILESNSKNFIKLKRQKTDFLAAEIKPIGDYQVGTVLSSKTGVFSRQGLSLETTQAKMELIKVSPRVIKQTQITSQGSELTGLSFERADITFKPGKKELPEIILEPIKEGILKTEITPPKITRKTLSQRISGRMQIYETREPGILSFARSRKAQAVLTTQQPAVTLSEPRPTFKSPEVSFKPQIKSIKGINIPILFSQAKEKIDTKERYKPMLKINLNQMPKIDTTPRTSALPKIKQTPKINIVPDFNIKIKTPQQPSYKIPAPLIPTFDLPKYDRKKKANKKEGGYTFISKYQPSLTGLAFELKTTGKEKKQKIFTGFELRGL